MARLDTASADHLVEGQSATCDILFQLGVMYATGQGVERDDACAALWYRTAAEQGDPSAQNNLGAMYANGQGLEQSDVLAVFWYARAAEQGHALAQYNLGSMYHAGRGVRRDPATAYMWMLLAAQGGDATAVAGRELAEQRLPAMQIERGREMAARWQAARPPLQ